MNSLELTAQAEIINFIQYFLNRATSFCIEMVMYSNEEIIWNVMTFG